MQDALLIYLMIANMRHAGYFRGLAAALRYVQTRSALMRSIAARICGAAADAMRRRVWDAYEAGMLPRVTAPSSHRAIGSFHWAHRCELNQALTRLESYVGTMA
jgi:hypothetical protein